MERNGGLRGNYAMEGGEKRRDKEVEMLEEKNCGHPSLIYRCLRIDKETGQH